MTWQPTQGEAWRAFPDTYAAHKSGGKFKLYRHVDYISSRITPALARGGARIIVNEPPRHGKSHFLSSWLPTWFLDTWPTKQVALMSYSDSKADDWGREVRDRFGDLVRQDKCGAGDWELKTGGGMICVGIKGGLTGRGADLLIIDDPHKNWEDAHSPAILERLYKTYDSTAKTRLEPGASIIVVQTRWQKRDLTGWLLAEKDQSKWIHISLPAIAEENDPMGREVGEPLCPERYPLESTDEQEGLLETKEDTPPAIWDGMYQQKPTIEGGNLWKGEWFNRWTKLPEGNETGFWFMSLDSKNKGGVGCPAVLQVWLVLRGNEETNGKPRFFLVDQRRGLWSTSETIEQVRGMAEVWPSAAFCILIEDKASGPAVIEALQSEFGGLVPINPVGSKYSRAAGVEPKIRNGRVWIPAHDTWVPEFIDEVTAFPAGLYNDQVDATSQALSEGEKYVAGFQVGALLSPTQRGRHERVQKRKRVISPWLSQT